MNASSSRRLFSLDALRGFAMFWIIGGDALVRAMAQFTDWPLFRWMEMQCEHVAWNGFHAFDLVFPLFLFVSGVTMPFSLVRRLGEGERRADLYKRMARRAVLLVLLGLVYNRILAFQWVDMRYASVLGRIGAASFLAGLIVLNAKPRTQMFWVVGILLGYWAVMALVPVPGFGHGVFSPEGNLAGFVDRHLLPGRLYAGSFDPEGLLSTLPAVATVLLGAIAGEYLRYPEYTEEQTALRIFIAGVVALALGWFWDGVFPVNKSLWTSSFVLVAGGWSKMQLAGFYYVVDVLELRRWAWPLVLIGLNPITIYLVQEGILNFPAIAQYVLGGLVGLLPGGLALVAMALGVIAAKLLFLWFLDRQKIYLKV